MNSIPQFFIKNYQFTITAFVFLLALGINSYLSMPRSEDPVLDLPMITVITIYPGASPKDIESQVVDQMEEAINELDDIVDVNTSIRDGLAVIRIEFLFGVDLAEKEDEVQSQVNSIKGALPSGIYDINVNKQSTSNVSIFQLALVSKSAPYNLMKTEAERLKKIIERVNGVRKVKLEAYPESEVRIALNSIKMTEMNISLDNIQNAIQSNNATIPGGALKVSDKLFNVKTSGAYSQLEEIKNTVVGSFAGKIIYLKNIASVYFDYEDERYLSRFNGERNLIISIQQKEGYNIFNIADPIREKLAATKLADDMQIEYVFDQAVGVKERVNTFMSNLIQGILLVGVIIFLVLGVRSASIVILTIPLSILIGLASVDFMGFGLQQMSITGLVVALGLLVDNSIAIIENIERFLGMGYSKTEAAIKGTGQLVAPMVSATLTTILAFVPVIMMPETTGAFIKAMPATVIATLVASLVIAVSLTPFMASRILKKRTKESVKLKGTFAFRGLKKFVEGPYRKGLNWALRNRTITLLFALGSFIGAILLFPYVGVSFFPKAEKPQFRITVSLPNGNNLNATDNVVKDIEAVLAKKEVIKYYSSNIGHGNPRLYYNIIPRSYSNNFAEIFVVLKRYNVTEFYQLLDDLRAEFGEYPNAQINVREFIQGPPSEAPIAIKIYGDDLDKLQAYSRQIESIAKKEPGAINVENSLSTNGTDLFFKINKDKATMLGVPIFEIDKTIRSFVNGTTIGKFRDTDAEEFNIVMRYDFDKQFQLDDFDKISVKSMNNRFIPLKQLASIEFAEAPTTITHFDSERTATILADVTKNYILDDVAAKLGKELDQLSWEEGYRYEFKGDLAKREESFGGLGVASGLALLLILGVLIIQFKSFAQPLIIFSALPLAIIGSIFTLYIAGVSFSFTAFIGLISLIGIAINNSIVLVDFANELRDQGKSVMEAAKQAGEVRFIPIVLTTLTTILGLLPLTLGGGSMWAPMGWTIIGGLITSTFFVLLVVPILYQLFTKENKEEIITSEL